MVLYSCIVATAMHHSNACMVVHTGRQPMLKPGQTLIFLRGWMNRNKFNMVIPFIAEI